MSTVAPPSLPGVTHEWVQAGDLRVHVALAGPADPADERFPPVVLVHGWPQHWWCWNRVIGPLAADRRVIAVDLRGHGWTDAPDDGYDKHQLAADLLATIDSLGLPEVDLVGHDLGGWTSLLLAQEAPDRVRRVAAVAIPAPWAPVRRSVRGALDLAYQLAAGGPLGPVLHRGGRRQAFLRLIFRASNARRRWWPEADLETYLERWRDPARARAGTMLYRTFLRHEIPDILRGEYSPDPPQMPVLLLAGRSDPVCRPGLVGEAVGTAPDVAMDVIAGSGHWVPEEQPDVLVAKLRTFLG